MGSDSIGGLDEAEIIKMLAETLSISDLDDASPMDEGGTVYLTSDMMLQSTDLPENTHPTFWGLRMVAANVSDMSAMGCRPVAMMVSLGLTEDMTIANFRDLLEGLRWACREGGLKIIGGDTNRAPEIIISGFITGSPFGRPFKRSGARPGDAVYVTGSPGSAALGLALIESKPRVYFDSPDILEEELEGSAVPVGSFLAPEMRIKEAEDLSYMGVVTSCIDISDGISTDAGHVAQRSGVRMIIEEEKLPFTPQVRGIAKLLSLNPTDLALNGGDDFELLFTAPQESEDAIREAELGVPVGEVTKGSGVALRRSNGRLENLKSSGYQHFTRKGR